MEGFIVKKQRQQEESLRRLQSIRSRKQGRIEHVSLETQLQQLMYYHGQQHARGGIACAAYRRSETATCGGTDVLALSVQLRDG